jgi:phage tail protein X
MNVQAQQDDTVDELLAVLRQDGGVTEAVHEANPGLCDSGPLLSAGQVVYLPELPPPTQRETAAMGLRGCHERRTYGDAGTNNEMDCYLSADALRAGAALSISALMSLYDGQSMLKTATGSLVCGSLRWRLPVRWNIWVASNAVTFVGASIGFMGADKVRNKVTGFIETRIGERKEMSEFKFSQRSENNLKGVNADLVKVVRRALQLSAVDFGITEGLRSVERQKQLVAEGKARR